MFRLVLMFFGILCTVFLSPQPIKAVDLVDYNIHWTAVGDDGLEGTAATYDIRISPAPITSANWATAAQLINEPIPSIAGTRESYTITDLQPGFTYYVAIKTADEVPNWSDLSNVLMIVIPDITPPAAITTLSSGS